MATFKEILKDDVDKIIFNTSEFAEASTFRALGQTAAAPVKAIWDYLNSDDMRLPESSSEARYAQVEIMRSELSQMPSHGDEITNAADELFIVLSIVSADDDAVTVKAVEQSKTHIGSVSDRLKG